MPDKALICKFQSTPSQRGRRYFDLPPKECKNFNPRPRKEGDMNTLQNAQPIILFQSTPSQRGRQMDITQIIEELDFNPRPRKEGDLHRGETL